jgi:hypothetical protein
MELVAHVKVAKHSVNQQLAALRQMGTTQLRAKYLEVFGEPSRSGNKDYLFKKLAWRIQPLAEGGLPERARRRAEELARDADVRTTVPRPPKATADAAPRTLVVAETKVEEFVAGKGVVVRWERIRRQNHWFDALYNACAAGHGCEVRLVEEQQAKPAPPPAKPDYDPEFTKRWIDRARVKNSGAVVGGSCQRPFKRSTLTSRGLRGCAPGVI